MAPGKFRPEIWLITGMRTVSLGVGVPIVRTHTLEQEVKAQFSLPAFTLAQLYLNFTDIFVLSYEESQYLPHLYRARGSQFHSLMLLHISKPPTSSTMP